MSRTRLCVLTAAALACAALLVMGLRRRALGPDAQLPHGPDTWKVTMVVQGKSTGDARVATAAPLDTPRQHVAREEWHGDGFSARPQEPTADRRGLAWSQRPGAAAGPFHLRYDAYCTLPPPAAHAPPDAADRP